MFLRPLAFAAFTACTFASAGPVAPPVKSEIDALLSSLSSSGCEFNRNGAWHNSAEAKSHLLRKLDYLEKKNMVQSTEQFIERAAASSSSSGEAYQVKCTGGQPIDSKAWMLAQLKVIRSSPPSSPRPAPGAP